MLNAVVHIGYYTDDVEAAYAFYQRTFGATINRRVTGADGTRMLFVQVGNTEVELIEPADRSRLGGRTGLIIDHVGYWVDDVEVAIHDLKGKGIAFTADAPSTNPATGTRIIFTDPTTTLGARMHLNDSGKRK